MAGPLRPPGGGARRLVLRLTLPCRTLGEVGALHPELERGRFKFRTRQRRPIGTRVRLEAMLRDGAPAFGAAGVLESQEDAGPDVVTWTLALSEMDEAGKEFLASIMEGLGGDPPREPPPSFEIESPEGEGSPPSEDTPSEDTPSEDAPSEVAASEEAPSEGVPFEEVPFEDVRREDASSEDGEATPPSPRPSTAGEPPPLPKPAPVASATSSRPAAPRGPPPKLAPGPAAEALEPGPVEDEVPEIPMERRKGPIIGIDLGTTNSAVAVVKNGKPFLIPSREGYTTFPSVVSLTDRGSLVVGHFARDRMLVNPRNTVHGAKRLIGRQFASPVVRDLMGRFSYEIVAGPRGEAAVKLGGRVHSLQKISSMVLAQMKDLAERWLGEEVCRAVITVPAYYNDNQRQAVRAAGALAGLHVERIVNEPTAAAIAFAQGRQLEQRVTVYDLGGGTFDSSVLQLHGNVYEVVSTGGDTFLGGVDFDQALVKELLERFREEHGVDFSGDRVAYQRIADAAERAKIALSERLAADVDVPFVTMVGTKAYSLKAKVTRPELEALSRPLVERTLRVCDDVLTTSGLRPSDAGEVLLVGGQSRMPLVRSMIRDFFGREPSKSVHPDEAVAVGAALLADSIRTGEIGGIVLVDVLPMSIGVGLPGGRFKKVIERNTPLPHKRTHTIWVSGKNQKLLSIPVYQGESDRVQENEYLGTLLVADLPPGADGDVVFDVVFSISPESILTVTAEERGAARTVSATFSMSETPEAVRRRLDAQGGTATGEVAAAPATAPPTFSTLERAKSWLRSRLRAR